MANTKIEFLVKAPAEELYLVGNIAQLGEWNVAKAIKLNFCEECGKFTVTKMLPLGENIEFKVLAAKNWEAVEKGIWKEDLPNHAFVATKGTKVEIEISNF